MDGGGTNCDDTSCLCRYDSYFMAGWIIDWFLCCYVKVNHSSSLTKYAEVGIF